MHNNYICALDIGSSKIAAALARLKKGRITDIFFDSAPSRGIKHGVLVDTVELVNSVSRVMKNLKAKSGLNFKFIYTNISGQNIITKHSHAILPLAERGNKVITMSDVRKVNEEARILGSSLEEEIIHLVPHTYAIDSKSNLINPSGLYSHKLEVDLYLVCARLSSVESLNRAINQSGFEIKDLFFSGLVTSKIVLDKVPKEGINVFCDIGSDSTELLVFKNGYLFELEILSIGADDLTNKLSETLEIPFALAEDIKRSYGIIGDAKSITEDKEILVKRSELYKPIKQRVVSELIAESAKTICSKIKETLKKKAPTYEINNFVVVGRAVLLEGFIEALENTLAIPVKLGRLDNPDLPLSIKEDTSLSGNKYLTYLTTLGIIYEALQGETIETLPNYPFSKNPILRVINRLKEVYQEYF